MAFVVRVRGLLETAPSTDRHQRCPSFERIEQSCRPVVALVNTTYKRVSNTPPQTKTEYQTKRQQNRHVGYLIVPALTSADISFSTIWFSMILDDLLSVKHPNSTDSVALGVGGGKVGPWLVSKNGAGVGVRVGSGVAGRVTSGVGAGVGSGVGERVGWGVGAGVGSAVGAGVGSGVGAGVGAGVASVLW